MDFFAAQDRARRSSRLLVWWFVLCVFTVVAAIYGVLRFWHSFSSGDDVRGLVSSWWEPSPAAVVAPFVAGIIIIGSIYKLNELAAGGAVVARSLGGRLVPRSTKEPLERRLINVVDEMAIASGLPSPEIWLLEEETGINAFAAGTDPGNAVIGVTTGCLEQLSRDELQGVVAHEFSHILNGDMKLNQTLAGWVFGLVMVSLLGRHMLELLRTVRSSSSSAREGEVRIALATLGFLLWLVGGLGVFCSRLLQAAISREREYLADAAAVQFTRNPAGLAGALKKIGGMDQTGTIHAPAVMEVRHLFFANAGGLSWGFLRTHPPLEKRIRALDPGWDGKMIRVERGRGKPVIRRKEPRHLVSEPVFITDPGNAGHLHAEVGNSLLAGISRKGLRLQSKEDARHLVLALLLGQNHETRAFQWLPGPGVEDPLPAAHTWAERLESCTPVERMALLDLSLPLLRRMTKPEARDFIDFTAELVAADGHISVFEFMLQKVIERQVAVSVGLRRPAIVRYHGIAAVADEVAELLKAFASVTGNLHHWAGEVSLEFHQHTGKVLPDPPRGIATFDPHALGAVLQKLDALPQLAKIQVLRLCGLVVMQDDRVTGQETELLRATAEAIGAPVPPFVRVVQTTCRD